MTVLTVREVERVIKVFSKVLPRNQATNKKWGEVDICRVIMKHCRTRIFSPSVSIDKIDMIHYLRRQYYSDIEVEARAKAAKLREETAQLRLVN